MTCSTQHRHGRLVHDHPDRGSHCHPPFRLRRSAPTPHGPHVHRPPTHAHHHHPGRGAAGDGHGHTHGLVDPEVLRSRAGLRTVGASLAVLGVTAALQAVVFVASGSVALLADLVHNGGDALTAVPLALAFALRSRTAERRAGLAVVAAIFASAVVVGVESVARLVHPSAPSHLLAVVAAGALGFVGNRVAAAVRTRAGRALDSAALVADGAHARTDAYVSLAVMVAAGAGALGLDVVDPVLGLVMAALILRITLSSWRTVRAA